MRGVANRNADKSSGKYQHNQICHTFGIVPEECVNSMWRSPQTGDNSDNRGPSDIPPPKLRKKSGHISVRTARKTKSESGKTKHNLKNRKADKQPVSPDQVRSARHHQNLTDKQISTFSSLKNATSCEFLHIHFKPKSREHEGVC